MKTECSRCGCTSTIMRPGNACHNECAGIMMPICKQCGYATDKLTQGYCYQCAVDKGIEINIFEE